ncbi:hypothetical protein DL240_06765 [Lujinxingia litoralis]|uniref:Pre ATP-grasp domain-containing protein n=1 Tax=Lujinxingia litoralis TaxID=2211119 RepID=A0A328CBH8_9DELT|nr:hypothetical protein [Lujinxingia litoralis]RAL23849.1 hypothetical protein DL240_06765 [Lujinxingia litoralis]
MQTLSLSPADREDARRVAAELRVRWELDQRLQPYRHHRFDHHASTWPQLHLEDVTGIPFLDDIVGIEEYQHRARVRAGSRDLFAASTTPVPGYEAYCQTSLKLGAPRLLLAADDDPRAIARACRTPEALDHLSAHARAARGLTIHPYMAIETVWELAEAFSNHADMPCAVLGPPPPILWIANDKSHLSTLVEDVLGPEWIVETLRASTPETIANALSELATRCDRVGLKRTRCASAMGNLVLDARKIRNAPPDEVLNRVRAFLTRTQWSEGEDVLIVEWVETDLSPSTQVWIPPASEGPPRLDGVYEQLLKGPEKMFLGSRPSTLPEALNQRMGRASLKVCDTLQHLGYVGRCSFDFIVSGDPNSPDAHPQITECNGRWGGTSTPMHLIDRLFGQPPTARPDYIATDFYLPESHRGMTFEELCDLLGDDLYSAEHTRGSFVLYNVGPLAELGKFDIIALGDSPARAKANLEETLPERLGL